MDNSSTGPPESSTPAFGNYTPPSTASTFGSKTENPSTGLSTNITPVFGSFTPPATAISVNSTQNLFSNPSLTSQTFPKDSNSQFGVPASSGLGSSGLNVFGSKLPIQTSFSGATTTSSTSLFGKGSDSAAFGTHGFQGSSKNQGAVFGSTEKVSTFPTSNLFATSATSTSNSSQNLFGKLVQNASTSSQVATTISKGANAPPASSGMQTANLFGQITVTSTPPLLFSGSKPSTVFGSTSTSASSSPNQLFGKNVSSTSVSIQSQAIQNKIPFGGAAVSMTPSLLFSGTKSKQSQAEPTTSTSKLFGKSIQVGTLFSGSQTTSSSVKPPAIISSKSDTSSRSEKHRTLFGKPQSQSAAFAEEDAKESSTFSDMRDNTIKASEEVFPFPSQSVDISESSQLPRHKESEAEDPRPTFARPSTPEQNKFPVSSQTFVPGIQLFKRALTPRDPSPKSGSAEDEYFEEEEILDTKSPRKSLSKWSSSSSSNRDVLAGFKKKGRLTSSSHTKSGVATSAIQSRRISKDQILPKSLIVKNIPPEYNNEEILRNHFSRFGKVTRFRLTTAKNMLTLTYDSAESATTVKREGHYIESGAEPLSIFLRALPVKSDAELPKHDVSSSVQNELQSMIETADYERESDLASSKASSSRRSTSVQKRSLTPPSVSSHKLKSDARSSIRHTERKRSPTPPPSGHTPDFKETAAPDFDVIKDHLKSLHSSRATTTTEKIAVLDTRDKILKLLRGRQQANLASAKAFVGACPDMCPEKERYYREDIRRLALYEVILSTMSNVVGQKTKVDHSKAVKEYSRSSADQEEPLPSELRPLPVLFNTMVYLLREVADQGGEGKWSEWYDFLWNRTRGIRKEITQQQLCALEVAELLEICARFHIFSSERLCEEDMMSFDDKINNENLTKCLQTLKELYADLETKQGVFCPNEAEFRAYMALMKLNEGDTLREVQQLRPDMRESGPIKFAIQAHTALNNNNYVRFFRLIEETTFLNGCILHRYFNQIRGQALRIIKKAYKGTTSSKFPVHEMMRLLKFEKSFQITEFCSYYCMEVEGNDIILDSRTFLEPESSLPHSRSPTLVESKQTLSVGETIYGGPLPAPQLPSPQSSFNEDGAFIFTQEFQQTLVQGGLRMPSGSTNSQTAFHKVLPAAPALKPVYTNEIIKLTTRTLILAETDTEVLSIAKEVIQEERERQARIALWLKEMIHSSISEELKAIVEEAVEDEETVLRQTIQQESKKQRERGMELLCSELLQEVEKEMVSKVAWDEMSHVEKELYNQCKERCTHACTGDLLENVIDEILEDIATDVYEVDVVARSEQLRETERIVQLMRASRWMRIWRDRYLRSVRVRRSMLDFPAAPPSMSQKDQISALVPYRPSDRIKKGFFFIGDRVKLNIQSPMDSFRRDLHLSAHLSMASAQQMLFNMRMWQPIDLAHCVANQILRAVDQWNGLDSDVFDSLSVQWKLVLSFPKDKFKDSEEGQKFAHWVKARLTHKTRKARQKKAPPHEGEILSQYIVQLPSRRKNSQRKGCDPSLSFCLRCFYGSWNESQLPEIKNKSLLKGNSGILFVTHTAEQLCEGKEALWKKERDRLHQLFTEKTSDLALPLVIVVPRETHGCIISQEDIKTFLKLSDLHALGLLVAVHVVQPFVDTGDAAADVNAEWESQLNSCLRYLATYIPKPPRLRVKNVSDFVEDAVVEFYKAPVYQDLRTRNRHQMLHQSPNVLISLYNDIIEHVGMTSSSDSLTKLSWPAPEFDSIKSEFTSNWNTDSHLADVYELITKLRLPTFRYSDRERDEWATLCQDVWNYINILTKKDSGSSKIRLFQQISQMLQSTKKQFDQFCWLASEDGPCEPSYVNMTWTDFIDACIHYKLVSLRTGHLRIELPKDDDEPNIKEEDVKELLVFFHEEELADWEAAPSWEEALRDTESLKPGQLKASVQWAATRRTESIIDLDTSVDDDTRKSNVTTTQSDTSTISPPHSWERIREQFERERKESERLENILTSSLKTSSLSTSSSDRRDSLISQDYIISDPRSIGDTTSSLKRRRMSNEKCKPQTESTSPVTPRSDLPRTRFEKHRRLDENTDWEFQEKSGSDEKEWEVNLRDVLTTPSISTRFEKFKQELQEERKADELFELKMTKWLSTPS